MFVQIIDYHTSKFEEMEQLGKEWEAAAQSDTTARRRVLGRDHDNPNHYVNIVFFDSYESAMQNSNRPTTQEFAAKMMALADGAPSFHDLDIVEDVTY
jgi:quinol monooxygenase YgiN